MKLFKVFIFINLLVLVSILGACSDTNKKDKGASFPEKDINGIVQFGEGGSTDNVVRSLAPLVEESLGESLVIQNKTGAGGAVATQYVYGQKPDGYTLLFGAEPPLLYQVLDTSERDYLKDFYPISLMGQGLTGVFVNKNSDFDTLEELNKYAKDNPGELNFATSGSGTISQIMSAMFKSELGAEFNNVAYDGDDPMAVALLGEEVDVSAVGMATAKDYVKNNDLKMLAIIDDERLEDFPDVKALSEIYPDFEKYLPFGPFYGVFVHKETPDKVKKVLTNSFKKAQESEKFKELLTNLGAKQLNIHGEEAREYMKKWQSQAAWFLEDAGKTVKSPSNFDIPKPD